MTAAEKYPKQLEAQGKTPEEIRVALKAARARFDGKATEIPASIAKFFAGIPASEQDALLGPRKAKLFREGKITTARELLACADRPLNPSKL